MSVLPRITRFRGGFAIYYWEDGRRRRFSLGTDDIDEARRRAKDWKVPESKAAFTKNTIVYFVRCECQNGFIKIGLARDLATRLSSIQTTSPYPLTVLATMPGGRLDEQRLHEQFAADWVRGEWFNASPALLAFIDGIPKPKTPEPIDFLEDMISTWQRFFAEEDARLAERTPHD